MFSYSTLFIAIPAAASVQPSLVERAPAIVMGEMEVRERVQFVDNPEFNQNSTDPKWIWTQRIALPIDYNFGNGWSTRVHLQSALKSHGQNSSVDSNIMSLREASFTYQQEALSLKFGRQEISVGSQRLLGVRDGTNVRRNWDGVSVEAKFDDWRLNGFAAGLVQVESKGVFNDRTNAGALIAGALIGQKFSVSDAEYYYIYTEREAQLTLVGSLDQTRHTIGARAFGKRKEFFWDWEFIYQLGNAGMLDVEAWSIATHTGYKLNGKWEPEIMVSFNVASGDDNPNDNTLRTFDALYPRGNYFSDLALLGPANFVNFNPYLRLSPADHLRLSFDINWFWRVEEEDGVYRPNSNLIRGPSEVDAKFVNTAISASGQIALSENVDLEIIYTRSIAEEFIQQTGPSETINFVELSLRTNF